jgi:hypothetical protein
MLFYQGQKHMKRCGIPTPFKWLFVFAFLCTPWPLWAANQAEVMMLPTRVVMENKDRTATVVIKNVGQATGNFSVTLIDMKMEESGMVVPVEGEKSAEYSAIPYIRIAPRSMTLKPNESQNVRLMLRIPEGLENGEYRAHLRVKIENDNVDDSGQPINTKDVAIAVKANLVLIIPVIIRHGETSLVMQIDSPKITHDSSGAPQLDMYLKREGNRSSMGDVSVNYSAASGKPQLLKFFPGVPVYRPTPRRFISIPLDVPKGVTLSSGSLHITYDAQEKEGGQTLAETTMPLP